MTLTIKQELRLAQQLVLTPQLQQAIKLLQLSRMELVDVVREEMLENPVLVDETDPTGSIDDKGMSSDRDNSAATSLDARGSSEQNDAPKGDDKPDGKDPINEIDWENYLDSYSYLPANSSIKPNTDELPSLEATLTKSTELSDHLEWQLRLSHFTKEEEYAGMVIIHNLDDDGYLKGISIEEIASEAGVSVEVAESALTKIQEFDPVGVAARDLRECLLIQAKLHYPGDDLLVQVIEKHIGTLERKNYGQIARDLKAPMEEIVEIAKCVANMDPKPGRIYSGDSPVYITPDIYVYKVGDEYMTVLNEDGMPKLRVSNYYRQTLAQKDAESKTKDYIQDKLRSAVWLIRSIHQRQRTILKVTQSIVRFQRDFLDKGIGYLKPLILRDVAADIGMHESTISRVTTNKYVHTPQGTFELKYFFNSGIGRFDGEDIASASVKNKIRRIIAAEEPKRPYSDQKIAELLAEQDIDIARRTVAKYREMMGILPSNKRKRMF